MSYYITDDKIVSTCDFTQAHEENSTIIYEVIRVIDSKPIFFQDHIDRFYDSINHSGNNTTLTKSHILEQVYKLIEVNRLSIGNIRFQIKIKKNTNPIFSTWISPFYYPDKTLYKKGVKLISLKEQRENPNLKIHKSEFKDKISAIITKENVYEILLLNNQGLITEGSRSNIFFIDNKSIITPKTTDVLPGITRKKIIKICKEHDINLAEDNIRIKDLSSFDGAFLSGTSPKVLPINKIDTFSFNPQNEIVNKLMHYYNHMIDNYLKHSS